MNQTRALTKSEASQKISKALSSRSKEFQVALGVAPERFLRIAQTAIANNPRLLQCDPASIVGACLEAAQCGLNVDPVLGEGALVPFKGQAKFIPGYRGLAKMAMESEFLDYVDAEVVYEKDEFQFIKGTDERLHHVPNLKVVNPGPVVAAYAQFVMRSGRKRFVVMPVRELEAIRKRSPGGAKTDGPWTTDYAEMCKKTAVRRGCKLMPLSPRAERALSILESHEGGIDVQVRDVTPEREESNERVIDVEATTEKEDQVEPEKNEPAPAELQDEEPPPPTEEYEPPRQRAAAPADPEEDARPVPDTINDEQRKNLARVLGQAEGNPRALIEGIIERELKTLSDLTVAEYWKIIEQVAPEEMQGALIK